MALVYKDRVKETTTTTGTGTLTLAGAATGYQAFSAVGDGNTCIYALEDANGTGWEVGIGTYTASGTTLARTTILSSSNSGSAINLSAGTHSVFVTLDARIAQAGNRAYNDHAFIIRQDGNGSSQQAITASTYTNIEGDVLNTTVLDRSSAVSNVGTGGSAVTFTAPEAGVYLLGGLVTAYPLAANSRVIALLAINGGDNDDERLILSRGWNNVASGTMAVSGAHHLLLAANDTITLQFWTDSSGSPTVDTTDSRIYFSGRLVSRGA